MKKATFEVAFFVGVHFNWSSPKLQGEGLLEQGLWGQGLLC
jgi:hypothetical protein